MRDMVVIERGETSWGAHVPDLPGCVAVAETRAEVLELIREGVELCLEEQADVAEPLDFVGVQKITVA